MAIRDWASGVLRAMADRLSPKGYIRKADGPSVDSTRGFGSTQVPKEAEESMAQQRMSTAEAFGPGRPLSPFAPWGETPRQWDYPTGLNIVSRPRSTAAKVSFDTLRAIIESYDVARLCIERRADEIRALDWHIVPADGVEEDVTDQIKQARKFFERPDGYTPFDSWQQMFLEDVLGFDAGAIYKHRTRGGKLGALEVVDGTTIAPLVDYWGRVPNPPAPAFAQFVRGVPWVWMSKDELIYQPFRAQPRSPYGLPPVEWLLLTINTDLRWQWHFLLYFTEGTVPDMFMQAPPDMTDPKQIAAFQELWDSVMAGEQGQKHKVKWIPHGAQPIPAKNTQFDPEFPIFLLKKTCAAFKVTPAEIGFTDDVNRATSEMQENVQWRSSILPLVRYLEGIYTRVLQEDLGLPLKFQFDVGGEKEDRLREAQTYDIYVRMGAVSVDEVRERLGYPVEGPARVPRFIITGSGPIPLDEIAALKEEDETERAEEKTEQDQTEVLKVSRAIKVLRKAEDGQSKEGPPSEFWGEELDPEDVAMLSRAPQVGSRYLWVTRSVRLQALQKSADDLYEVIRDFFEEEARKLAAKIGRKRALQVPTMDEIRRAVDEAIAEYDWSSWDDVLRPQVQTVLEEAFRRSGRETWKMLRKFGIDVRWELINERAKQYAEKRAAELVGKHVLPDGRVIEAIDPKMRIDTTTREMMRQDLTRWIGEGRGWAEIARLIEDRQYTGFFSDWRARRIARTEAAFADNGGSLAGYRLAGVTKVRVIDGTVDQICREANGQIWGIDYAEAHPLGHPHCSRTFVAILPEPGEA